MGFFILNGPILAKVASYRYSSRGFDSKFDSKVIDRYFVTFFFFLSKWKIKLKSTCTAVKREVQCPSKI